MHLSHRTEREARGSTGLAADILAWRALPRDALGETAVHSEATAMTTVAEVGVCAAAASAFDAGAIVLAAAAAGKASPPLQDEDSPRGLGSLADESFLAASCVTSSTVVGCLVAGPVAVG